MTVDLWSFRGEVAARAVDLQGMSVEALDGSVGKVQDVIDREGSAFLLVDTGPWIFGKTVKLPAGLVSGVDAESGSVRVDRAKEEIKNAPEYDTAAEED